MILALQPSAVNTPEARMRRRPLLRFARSDGRLTGMAVFSLIYPSVALAEMVDPLRLGAALGAGGVVTTSRTTGRRAPARTAPATRTRQTAGAGSDARARVRLDAARIGRAFLTLFNQPEAMALIRSISGDEPYWRRALEHAVAGNSRRLPTSTPTSCGRG